MTISPPLGGPASSACAAAGNSVAPAYKAAFVMRIRSLPINRVAQ
jgi:hypothetical protein